MLANHVVILVLLMPCVRQGVHLPLRMSIVVLLAAVFLVLIYGDIKYSLHFYKLISQKVYVKPVK